MHTVLVSVSALCLLSSCGQDTSGGDIETADELIARHMDAIGGREAWLAVKTVTSYALYREGDTRERHRLDRKRPNRIRITARYDPATGAFGYAEGYDGAAWEYRARVPIRVTGTPARALERAAAFDPAFLDYARKGNQVELIGRITMLGRDVYQLRITGIDGNSTDDYFDARSLMRVMSRALAPHHGDGAPVDIVSIRDDFRRVGGVMLAYSHAERALPSGEQLSTWTAERIEVNRDLPDDWFAPPLSDSAAQYQVVRHAALDGKLTELDALFSKYVELDRAEAERRRESELNTLGYELLSHERFPDAIAVFQLALTRYPTSANLHDSLGEAYMLAKDAPRAIESYQRSIELNPENKHGATMIEKLERSVLREPARP